MILRLRGDLSDEIDWPSDVRVPEVAELLSLDGAWYRVTMVAWAVRRKDGATNWDAGLVLASSSPHPALQKPT